MSGGCELGTGFAENAIVLPVIGKYLVMGQVVWQNSGGVEVGATGAYNAIPGLNGVPLIVSSTPVGIRTEPSSVFCDIVDVTSLPAAIGCTPGRTAAAMKPPTGAPSRPTSPWASASQ